MIILKAATFQVRYSAAGSRVLAIRSPLPFQALGHQVDAVHHFAEVRKHGLEVLRGAQVVQLGRVERKVVQFFAAIFLANIELVPFDERPPRGRGDRGLAHLVGGLGQD